MEHGWNGIETGNPKYSEKSLSQWHMVSHKCHTDWNLWIHITSFHTSDRTEHALIRETSQLKLGREITVVKTSDICEIHA